MSLGGQFGTREAWDPSLNLGNVILEEDNGYEDLQFFVNCAQKSITDQQIVNLKEANLEEINENLNGEMLRNAGSHLWGEAWCAVVLE